MTYFTTKVTKLEDLAAKLTQLKTAGHTIVQILNVDGNIVIISTTGV